ncbi:hypothetical protein I5485_07810 [Citrobacter farmeri]|uniref:hypothetical protein n=1 Tax=Citrobacter farmeri TaxID=67824 RepID=UPI0019053FA3|nr:hypothetical protein [Citrobacter farmeri]MBJ9162343.1 hypothetical protein [Citrobacter farmeri]
MNTEKLLERVQSLESDCWIYENTIKKLLERAEAAEAACAKAFEILDSGERMALVRAKNVLHAHARGEESRPYQYPVVLPEPLGWKSPSGNEVLKKKDVIAALVSAGVPVEKD